MALSRRAGSFFKRAVIFGCAALAILVLLLAAAGFGAASLFIWLAHDTGPAWAAAIAAFALAGAAILVGLGSWATMRRLRPTEPGLLAQVTDLAGTAMRLATIFVQRDPKKALIASLIAGALAEYLSREDKKS